MAKFQPRETQIVTMYLGVNPGDVKFTEQTLDVRETEKQFRTISKNGYGSSVYPKDELDFIRHTYFVDSQFSVSRTVFCRVDNADEIRNALFKEVQKAAAEVLKTAEELHEKAMQCKPEDYI